MPPAALLTKSVSTPISLKTRTGKVTCFVAVAFIVMETSLNGYDVFASKMSEDKLAAVSGHSRNREVWYL